MPFCICHRNLLSSFILPLIPLHILCTLKLQKWQKMESQSAPFFITFSASSSQIIIFVFLTFTCGIFDSNAPFQFLFFLPCLQVFYWLMQSHQHKASFGHPNLISPNSVSSTMINNKGINTDPTCNRTWNRKSSHQVPLTLTGIQSFLYTNCALLTNHSPMPSFFKTQNTTFLRNWSRPISKFKNSKSKFFFFTEYFSCNLPKLQIPLQGMLSS